MKIIRPPENLKLPLPLTEVLVEAEKLNVKTRISKKDGKYYLLTRDLRLDRWNITIETINGEECVTEIEVG